MGKRGKRSRCMGRRERQGQGRGGGMFREGQK